MAVPSVDTRPSPERDVSASPVALNDGSSPFHTGPREGQVKRQGTLPPKQWRSQHLLSFDGGGIRGYSSLLILKELMTVVERIEKAEDASVESSYDPLPYISPPNNRLSKKPSRKITTFVNGSGGPRKDTATANGNGTAPQPTPQQARSKFLPCHYFDFVGGTSTGGLICIMLGRLRLGVDECLEEYEQLGGRIFGNPRWASVKPSRRGPIPAPRDKYDGRNLQGAVEEVVARRLPKSQLRVGAGNFTSARELCRTAIFAYQWTRLSGSFEYGPPGCDAEGPMVDPENPGAYIFRSYDHWGPSERDNRSQNPGVCNPGASHSIPIWQVARAATAAPFYFDPIEIQNRKFGDGGFGTNNPVRELYFEARYMHGNDPRAVTLVVSIGTGQAKKDELSGGLFAKYIGYFKAVRQLATDSEREHRVMHIIRDSLSEMHCNLEYFRLNVPRADGLGDMKLDEWKGKEGRRTLDKIRCVTLNYCRKTDMQQELEKIARLLVDQRRARCHDDIWGLYATGMRYRCTVTHCWNCQKLRPSGDTLREHLIQTHSENINISDEAELDRLVEQGRCAF